MWELYSIGLSIIAIYFTHFYMPESPRFYYSRNKFDLARKSLNQIASFNGITLPRITFDKEMQSFLLKDKEVINEEVEDLM